MNLTATKQFAAQQAAIRNLNPEAFVDLKEGYFKVAEGLERLRLSAAVLTPEQRAAVDAMRHAFNTGQMKWLGQIL